jgi:hypothetical protein
MKYLFLIIVLFPIATFAQLSKGDKFIGGYLSFQTYGSQNNQNGNNSYNSNFSITPMFGLLLNEKFALGGMLGYNNQNFKSNYLDNTNKSSAGQFLLGLVGRRYFAISEKLLFALHGDISYSRGQEKHQTSSMPATSNEFNGMVGGLKPLFIFFPTGRWGIEGGIGSATFTFRNIPDLKENNHSFSLSYGSLFFGISYYIK